MISRLRWIIISFLLGCGKAPSEPAAPVAALCIEFRLDTIDVWVDSTRYQEILKRCLRWAR